MNGIDILMLVIAVIAVCWLAGAFVAISLDIENNDFDRELARQDAEKLLSTADDEVTYRPRIRAGTHQ